MNSLFLGILVSFKRGQKSGFTLIELLITIVIIGILATVSVATYDGFQKRANDAKRELFVRNASMLLQTLHSEGKYTNYWFWDDTFQGGGNAVIHDRLKGILSAHDYTIPEADNEYCYVYSVERSRKQDFFIAVASEYDNDRIIIGGTLNAVAVASVGGGLDISDLVSSDGCTSQAGLPDGGRTVYAPNGDAYGAILLLGDDLY